MKKVVQRKRNSKMCLLMSTLVGGLALTLGVLPQEAQAKVLCDIHQTTAQFGSSAKIIPDMNNDGFNDILVCSRGQKLSVYGGAQCGLILELVGTGPSFCHSATAADVNGDGHPEILVGVPKSDNDRGHVEVYTFHPTRRLAQRIEGTHSGEQFGFALATFRSGADLASSAVGDAAEEVLIGAPGRNIGNVSAAGAVIVYTGGVGSGVHLTPYQTLQNTRTSPQAEERFGKSIDGVIHTTSSTFGRYTYASIGIGVPGYSDLARNRPGSGMVQLFRSRDGSSFVYVQRYLGGQAAEELGTSVSFSDSFQSVLAATPHLIAGAPGHQTAGGSTNRTALRNGAVHVLNGAAEYAYVRSFSWRGDDVEANIGDTVAALMDANVDGAGLDLAFGTFPSYQSNLRNAPFAHVWNPDGKRLEHRLSVTVPQVRLGTEENRVLVAAGDITADGRPELVQAMPGLKRVRVYMIGGTKTLRPSSGLITEATLTSSGLQYRVNGAANNAIATVHASLRPASLTTPQGVHVCIDTTPTAYLTSANVQPSSQGVISMNFPPLFNAPWSTEDVSLVFQTNQLTRTSLIASDCVMVRAGWRINP